MGDDSARYRFGPRERAGALAGFRAGQILTVALGLVAGVLVLAWRSSRRSSKPIMEKCTPGTLTAAARSLS